MKRFECKFEFYQGLVVFGKFARAQTTGSPNFLLTWSKWNGRTQSRVILFRPTIFCKEKRLIFCFSCYLFVCYLTDITFLFSFHLPILRNTTTLNIDSKVGMTTPNTTPSFRVDLPLALRSSPNLLVPPCLDMSLCSEHRLVVSR